MPTQNLLRFVTVAYVDDEDRVGNSLMHTWGSSGKIFKLEFGHYFASDILQRLRS